MNDRFIVQNNPVNWVDPWGLYTIPIPYIPYLPGPPPVVLVTAAFGAGYAVGTLINDYIIDPWLWSEDKDAKKSSEGKSCSARTPARGKPGTKQAFPKPGGGKTERQYGEDGRAVEDVDYGHDHGVGDPHVHDWDWSKNPPRQPGRKY